MQVIRKFASADVPPTVAVVKVTAVVLSATLFTMLAPAVPTLPVQVGTTEYGVVNVAVYVPVPVLVMPEVEKL